MESTPFDDTTALRIRGVQPSDGGFLYGLAIANAWSFRWVHGGTIPPFERFQQMVWQHAKDQYIIIEGTNSMPWGLAVLWGNDSPDIWKLDIVPANHDLTGQKWKQIASVLLDMYFSLEPILAIVFELPEWLFAIVQETLDQRFDHEGTISNHFYLNGTYQNLEIVAAWSNIWHSTNDAEVTL